MSDDAICYLIQVIDLSFISLIESIFVCVCDEDEDEDSWFFNQLFLVDSSAAAPGEVFQVMWQEKEKNINVT